jgi:hypothetical protein
MCPIKYTFSCVEKPAYIQENTTRGMKERKKKKKKKHGLHDQQFLQIRSVFDGRSSLREDFYQRVLLQGLERKLLVVYHPLMGGSRNKSFFFFLFPEK